jgi:GxxExxY protein
MTRIEQMIADKTKILHSNVTEKIIEAFYKVYENAMRIELKRMGMNVDAQKNIRVHYAGYEVGDYYADLIVNNLIILELKAAEAICEEHEAQLVNYLKATNIEVGLLLNFGKKPEFKRKVFMNSNKKSAVIR